MKTTESVNASGLLAFVSFGEESIVFSKKSTGAFNIRAKNTPTITGDRDAPTLPSKFLVTSRLSENKTIATIDTIIKPFFTEKVLTKKRKVKRSRFAKRSLKRNAKCKIQNAKWASLHSVSLTRKECYASAECGTRNAERLRSVTLRSQ